MKILAYKMFFHREFASALKACDVDIVFFSSERRTDESGVIQRFYGSEEEAAISNDVITDIIIRCRYLSSLNLMDSRKIARKMWASVELYFDTVDVDLLVSPAVDNYVTDIFYKVASLRKIPAFQPRRSPLPNLVRITNSIDNPALRQPSTAEINESRIRLQAKFKADYQNTKIRTPFENFIKAVREVMKKPIFEFWKIRYRDPKSFHYNAIFPNKNAITFKSVRQIWFHNKFKGSLSEIEANRANGKTIVFWPLAMTPESALCYMNADGNFSDYSDVINRVLSGLGEQTVLVVKEHPSAIGFRSLEQYEKLLNNDSVVFMNPATPTGQLIEKADAVLINTSSTTGLEAVALGKPVLAMGNCHYAVDGVVDEINSVDGLISWRDFLRTTPLLDSEVESVLRKYLSNTLVGGTWAQHNLMEPDYAKKIKKTLDGCIELVNAGYVPVYHGK